MDVGQAAAAGAAQTGAVTGSVAPAPAQGVVIPSSAPAPGVATPGTDVDPATKAAQQRAGLAPAIAKLFGGASPPEPIHLDVSYRVLTDPDQIVTVFSDPKTGEEVAQFPPEILIGLAQFFDSPRGVTLDRDA
jgi:uncharacterized FlaG/YvyC family protein